MVSRTRFPELGYEKHDAALWRIMDLTDSGRAAAVGPHYRSKSELLADLDRYAAEFGCDLATGIPANPQFNGKSAYILGQQLQADPAVSFWLKKAIRDLDGRDPVDAMKDAVLLAQFQEHRLAEVERAVCGVRCSP